jgi:hypothetical protein
MSPVVLVSVALYLSLLPVVILAQTIVPPTYYTDTTGTVFEPSSNGAGATANLKKSVQGVQYISCPAGSVVTGSFSLFDVGFRQNAFNWPDCSTAATAATTDYQTNPSSSYCGIKSSANKCSYSFVQIFNYKVGGYLGGAVILYTLLFVAFLLRPHCAHHPLTPSYPPIYTWQCIVPT